MRKGYALLVLLLFFTIAVYQTAYQTPHLIISGSEKECAVPVSEGDVIAVSFIHSVELFREVDLYRVENNSLKLFKTLVKSAGWGLPSTEKNFSSEKGWLEYRIERDVGVLRISLDPFNRYTLKVGEMNLSLDEFGKYVELRVEKMNPISAAFWRCEGGRS